MPEHWDVAPVLTSNIAQGGVADQAGGIAYSGVSDSSTAGEIAFQGPTADFILSGVVNGLFAQLPPDTTQNIEPVNNPMPYWYGPVVVQGSGWAATSVVNSSFPSGYGLRLGCTDAVNNDEAYFEQIVPVASSYHRSLGNAVRLVGQIGPRTAGAPQSKVALQYLKADGTTTGSATSATSALGAGSSLDVIYGNASSGSAPPADAAYLRIRIGAVATASGSLDADLVEVRNDFARLRTMIGETTTPGSFAPGYLYQDSGIVNVYANGSLAASFAAAGSTMWGPLQSGKLTATAAVIQSNIISATISASQNDYAPAGLATCAEIALDVSGASRTITGFSATSFTNGQRFVIKVMNNDLVLAHASASSAVGNRLNCPGSANATIRSGGGVEILYDTTSTTNNPFRVLLP